MPLAERQPWLSWGELAFGLGEPQVRMWINMAEMFRGYGIGVLIRAGFLEEGTLN